MRHHGRMPDRSAHVDEGWRAVRAAAPAGPDADAAKRGRLTFLGHSTVLIEIDDLRILTDPVLREGVGPVRRQVQAVLPELFADLDAVFISHGHHDHLDPPSLRRIPGKPTLIVPRGFGRIAEQAGARPGRGGRARRPADDRPRPVRGHLRRALGPPRAVRADRPGDRLRDRGARGRSTSRATRTCSRRWASSPGALDVAMLPVWGWGPTIGEGHMNPIRAAAAAAHPPAEAGDPDPLGHVLPGGDAAGRARRRSTTPGHEFADALPVRAGRPGPRPGARRVLDLPTSLAALAWPETRGTPPVAGGVSRMGARRGLSRTRRGRRSRAR